MTDMDAAYVVLDHYAVLGFIYYDPNEHPCNPKVTWEQSRHYTFLICAHGDRQFRTHGLTAFPKKILLQIH